MNICIAAQIFLAMAQSHMDVPANHLRIAEAGRYMNAQCAEQEKQKAKVGTDAIGKKQK